MSIGAAFMNFRRWKLESSAPFGFFSKRRVIEVASSVLVYPEVKPLSHFDLLDRQFAPQVTRPTAGIGYEVMGLAPVSSRRFAAPYSLARRWRGRGSWSARNSPTRRSPA